MSKRYYEYSKERAIKIRVLGKANVGKTFLLSKISKCPLPHGSKTEGLSIKYPDLSKYRDRKIFLFDFCGFETPILTEENEKKILLKIKNYCMTKFIQKYFYKILFSNRVIFLF